MTANSFKAELRMSSDKPSANILQGIYDIISGTAAVAPLDLGLCPTVRRAWLEIDLKKQSAAGARKAAKRPIAVPF